MQTRLEVLKHNNNKEINPGMDAGIFSFGTIPILIVNGYCLIVITTPPVEHLIH